MCVCFFQAHIWQMRPKERMMPRTQTQPSSMPTATTHTQKKRKSISFRLQVALRSSLSSHSFPPSLHRVGTSSDSSGSFFSHFFSVLFVVVFCFFSFQFGFLLPFSITAHLLLFTSNLFAEDVTFCNHYIAVKHPQSSPKMSKSPNMKKKERKLSAAILQ